MIDIIAAGLAFGVSAAIVIFLAISAFFAAVKLAILLKLVDDDTAVIGREVRRSDATYKRSPVVWEKRK